MTIHASSCALHNAPASEPGPCDCGATDILERIKDFLHDGTPNQAIAAGGEGLLGLLDVLGEARSLLAECAITIKANRAHIESLDTAENQLIQEHDELNAALRKYGRHSEDCDYGFEGLVDLPCTCGFDKVRGKE